MPFLVRRRRDGLYYRNTVQPAWTERSRFSNDPRDCRPFFTEAGARRSPVAVVIPRDWPAHKVAVMKSGRDNIRTHVALRRRFWEEVWDELYELVEV